MSSEDRKRKLAEIRAKANKDAAPVAAAESSTTTVVETTEATEETEEVAEKKLKFRNYQPYDNQLKKLVKETDAKENNSSNAVLSEGPVETDLIKLELQKFQGEELNIMPKKPNWDLKVQVEGKLEKLKNRTQKAIVEILREKLAAEAQEE